MDCTGKSTADKRTDGSVMPENKGEQYSSPEDGDASRTGAITSPTGIGNTRRLPGTDRTVHNANGNAKCRSERSQDTDDASDRAHNARNGRNSMGGKAFPPGKENFVHVDKNLGAKQDNSNLKVAHSKKVTFDKNGLPTYKSYADVAKHMCGKREHMGRNMVPIKTERTLFPPRKRKTRVLGKLRNRK